MDTELIYHHSTLIYKINQIYLKVDADNFKNIYYWSKDTNTWYDLFTQYEPFCIGCIEYQPNQQTHMDPGGCLSETDCFYNDQEIKNFCQIVHIQIDELHNFIKQLPIQR